MPWSKVTPADGEEWEVPELPESSWEGVSPPSGDWNEIEGCDVPPRVAAVVAVTPLVIGLSLDVESIGETFEPGLLFRDEADRGGSEISPYPYDDLDFPDPGTWTPYMSDGSHVWRYISAASGAISLDPSNASAGAEYWLEATDCPVVEGMCLQWRSSAGNSTTRIGAMILWDQATESGYGVRLYSQGWAVVRWDAGTETVLDSGFWSLGPVTNFKIVIEGGRFKFYQTSTKIYDQPLTPAYTGNAAVLDHRPGNSSVGGSFSWVRIMSSDILTVVDLQAGESFRLTNGGFGTKDSGVESGGIATIEAEASYWPATTLIILDSGGSPILTHNLSDLWGGMTLDRAGNTV